MMLHALTTDADTDVGDNLVRRGPMKRLTLLPVLGLALFAACSDNPTAATDGPALARVKFIGERSCTQIGSNLFCDFKVAGLGNISTATVRVEAPFSCTKTTNGAQFVEPGGLASSADTPVPVSNGNITVDDFQVTGGRCPGPFAATFSGSASLFINGQFIGTILITQST
jgi:hypothetical protein